MTTSVTSLLDRIDAQVDALGLLRHPFYQAWNKGELSLEALRDYAAQYYQHVAAFPTYLSAVHAQCDDLAVRRHLLANLIDEEAGIPNHPQLWIQFANGLGLSRDEVATTAACEETRQLIATFRDACGHHGVAAGTAALYAYESQIPSVSTTKIAGLKNHYGITVEAELAYFHVHEEADREHAAVERELLSSLIDDSNEGAVMTHVDRVLTALNDMLSGVCRRHDIAC